MVQIVEVYKHQRELMRQGSELKKNITSRWTNALMTLSWPLLVACLISLTWLLQPVSPFLLDPDTYWHIATGHWILSHGEVPVTDPFSHTMHGQPWIAQEWLSAVLFARVHDALGWNGLVFVSIACGALTMAILARFLIDRMPTLYALIFLILTYNTLATHLLARPHILAWPLLMVWVSRLVAAAEAKTRPAWWLLGVMVLWANLHGSFILGLVIIIPLAIEAVASSPGIQRKQTAILWSGFAVLSVLCAMCTPHGWQGLTFIFRIMTIDHLQRVTEWQSSDFASLNPLAEWIYVLLALSCLGYLRLRIMRLLLLLGVLHMALAHARYISIFGLLAPILIATSFGHCYRARTERQGSALASLHLAFYSLARPANATGMLVGLGLVCLVAVLAPLMRDRTPDTNNTPAAAMDSAAAAGVTSGRVFNDYKFGGYLIYRGIPVFIDGRIDMYGNETLNTYLSIYDSVSKKQLAGALDKSHVTWTLMPVDSRLVDLLDELPEWQRIFADTIAVVHTKRP